MILAGHAVESLNESDAALLYGNILDEVSASITVIDSETYKIIYANKSALEATRNMPGSYVGSVCYEYIHGLNKPCGHCIMRTEEPSDGLACRDVSYGGNSYHQFFKHINWNGKSALLEYTEDVTPLETQREELERVRKEVLIAAENAGILYWSYDTKEHQTRIVNGKSLGYDEIIDNVPEIFRNTGSVHPKEEHLYFQLFDKMQQNVDSCDCEARIYNMVKKCYEWQHIIFVKHTENHYIGCSINIDSQKQNELYAEEREQELGRVLERITFGVAVYRFKDGRFSLVNTNEPLCKLLSTDLAEVKKFSSDQVLSYTAPEFRDGVKQEMKLLTQPGTYREFSFRANIPGKKEDVWLTVQARSFGDEENGILIYAGYSDITQRKRLEDERKKANAELERKYQVEKNRFMADSQVLAYASFNLTKDTVVDETRKGLLKPICEHMKYDEFIADISEDIGDKEQKAEFLTCFSLDNIMKAREDGIEEKSVQYQRTLLTGKMIWVRSTYMLKLDQNGTDVFLYYVCRNINESKVVELMSTYLVNTDYDMIGYVDFFDDSVLMMYGENSYMKPEKEGMVQVKDYKQALEEFVNFAIVPEEREQYRTTFFIQRVREELKKNEQFEFSCHIIDHNGERRTKNIRYKRDVHMPNACFFTQTDVTRMLEEEEKKRLELQKAVEYAQEANNAKTDFLSRMSHDMRTPMNAIIGLTALSLDEPDVSPVLRKNLTDIRSSGEFLLGLLNDVLDMSKIENGKVELRYVPYFYSDFLNSMKTMFAPMCEQNGLKFEFEDAKETLTILTDKIRLNQIFYNVLSNAVKYAPEGGTISYYTENLVIEGNRGHCDYIIQDTGIGMSEEF